MYILMLCVSQCYHPLGPRWASYLLQIHTTLQLGRGESMEITAGEGVGAPCTYRELMGRWTRSSSGVRKKKAIKRGWRPCLLWSNRLDMPRVVAVDFLA